MLYSRKKNTEPLKDYAQQEFLPLLENTKTSEQLAIVMPKDNKPKLHCSKDHLSSGTHLKSIRQVPRTLQTTAWNHAKIMYCLLETPAPPLQIPFFSGKLDVNPIPPKGLEGEHQPKKKTTLSPTTMEMEKLGPPNERKLLLDGAMFHFHDGGRKGICYNYVIIICYYML